MNNTQYRPGGFRVLPPVVKNIIIINVLLWIATYAFKRAFHIDLTEILGLHYFKSTLFSPYQLITYMFMHGGFLHIFFNMFALWMFGNVLENVWGAKRFLIYYMVTGIGAALIQMFVMWLRFSHMEAAVDVFQGDPTPAQFTALVHDYFPYYMEQVKGFITSWTVSPGNGDYIQSALNFVQEMVMARMNITTIGASGAVFGILLAFGMMFPNSLLYIYFAIPIKAKYFVMLYGGLELYLGFANNPGDDVAHFAHLGGMLFGFFLIRLWNRRLKRGR
jgi:membrane associated rhomboid family serine protease